MSLLTRPPIDPEDHEMLVPSSDFPTKGLKTLVVTFYHAAKDEWVFELSKEIFPLDERIENINEQYWTLRAEEIPEEEKSLDPHSRLIHVYHLKKYTAQNQALVQNFGEPFLLVIHEDETLTEVKARIQKKLQVSDEEFSKWKFPFVTLGRPEYLQDYDIVARCFQRKDVYADWEQYLGLEHTDNAPK